MIFRNLKIVEFSLWIYLSVWFFHCCCVVSSQGLDKTWIDSIDIKNPNKTNDGNKSETNVESPPLERLQSPLIENKWVVPTRHVGHHDRLPTPLGPANTNVRFKGEGIRVTTPKPSIVLTEEDKKARKDWGGNCTHKDWVKCQNETTFGKDIFDKASGKKIGEELSCANETLFPPICLFNGWTVTRCHLICLAKDCNGDLKINYEKYVSKDGFC